MDLMAASLPPVPSGTVHLKRVIPCLDVDAGRVVKGTNFVNLRDAGDPVELAERYDAEGADELIFLDITATHEKRDTIVDLARRTAENVFIPFTIGGGIRSVTDAQAVLDAGADAALAASIFHYGTFTIAQAKARLAQAGVPIRETTR